MVIGAARVTRQKAKLYEKKYDHMLKENNSLHN